LSSLPPTPTVPLFPYTTLFRSRPRFAHRGPVVQVPGHGTDRGPFAHQLLGGGPVRLPAAPAGPAAQHGVPQQRVGVPVESVRVPDRKSTRLNSSHVKISYAVFC